MIYTSAVEKVDWDPEFAERMSKRYGSGPFKVTKTSTRVTDNCYPGEHLHITVKIPGRAKPQTFCGQFLQPV